MLRFIAIRPFHGKTATTIWWTHLIGRLHIQPESLGFFVGVRVCWLALCVCVCLCHMTWDAALLPMEFSLCDSLNNPLMMRMMRCDSKSLHSQHKSDEATA